MGVPREGERVERENAPPLPEGVHVGHWLVLQFIHESLSLAAFITKLRAFRDAGYEVHTAATAESGLREFESAHPDAIILDLRMPFINGLGLLYRLRAAETDRRTPVVIITGDQCLDDAVIDELRGLGAEVKFKPLWLEDLVDVARSLVQARRQQLN